MRRIPRSLVVAVALVVACGCGPREHRLKTFDMVDLPVTSMFQQLAAGLDMPYVLELPLRASSPTLDLHLTDVTARDVIAELARKDPSFQGERRGGILLMWPTGAAEASSPYGVKVPSFVAEGGVGDVVSKLMNDMGHPAEVRAHVAIARRALKLDAHDASLRDVLAGVAEQAHAALIVQPGLISIQPLKEVVDTTR